MSLVKHTARIVQAYLAHNALPIQQVGVLIETVHQTLSALSQQSAPAEILPQQQPAMDIHRSLPVPFVPVEQAVTEESILCLICGKASKAIRGHLTKTHGIDVPTYLAHYGLPKDFPMVAPAYSATRRKLAIAAGAGEKLQAGRERKRGV
ncbi:MAG: MucR family transcriptional regulator [Magnetococcales bacterium]|nr:MucR family transcriptional regulator [Magnetococcales bacterium]